MKSWDTVTKTVKNFVPGTWYTKGLMARVRLLSVEGDTVRLGIGTSSEKTAECAQNFMKSDLTDLIEFLTELRGTLA